jgi:hypothetical protein
MHELIQTKEGRIILTIAFAVVFFLASIEGAMLMATVFTPVLEIAEAMT